MDLSDSAQLYGHLRILMATIIGLGVARLLIGFASMIEQPDRTKLSAVHLMWTASILLTLVNFWWWEFGLFSVIHWTYGDYIFLIAYCIVLFMLSALVFPSNIEKYRNYEDFFLSRRRWFFAFFAVAVLVAAAVLGIAEALPAWLAALIVAVALLVITGILAGIGVAQLKRGVPPTPTRTILSVKKDVDAVRGIGKREKP